ncbi:MAG TPA: ABC transporter permease [Alphaproteobacteria bacterium]|nr:ABC transporter permease [Alphaproteobacteria bacterium]
MSPHPARVDRAPGGGRIAPLLTPVAGILAVLAAWALVTGLFKIPDYLLPAPLDVARRLARDWASILAQAEFTLGATLAGFLVSVAIGVPLAFCIVLSRAAERALMPMFVMSQTIPKVAIAPILVVWLGFGMVPKIAIAFLIAFFPIVVSTVTGLKSVELDMLDLVRSMGAGTLKIMLRVRVPTALPHMFAGFKVAICLAVVGAIVGEFVGSDRGLGYVLLTATGSLDGTLVWSALIVLVAIGIALYAIVARIERVAIRWHVSVRADDATLYQS